MNSNVTNNFEKLRMLYAKIILVEHSTLYWEQKKLEY